MSGLEPKTNPDYYEKPLSEDSRLARVVFEKRLDDINEAADEARGIQLLKLGKKRERVEYMLSWQGANPKIIDIDELTLVIQQPLHVDSVEDKYRAKIKSQRTSIRAYCVSCQGGSVAGVKSCPAVTCPLFSFRMGKDPLRGFELPKAEDPEIEADILLEDEEDDYDEEDDDNEDEPDEN